MKNLFALLAAVVLTTIAISSASTASPASGLGFTLEAVAGSDQVRATFRRHDRENSSWSSAFAASQLAGLDMARFRAPGTAPVGFALVREAGRVDCAGTGGNSLARGSCRVTPDSAFVGLLERSGIGRPTEEQAYGLIALDVRRSLIEALAAARYPTPAINDLMGLTAVGVTSGYIDQMARAGYRPSSLNTLLEFRALGITPEYIQGFARLGYANLPPSELVQLKALDITADFIAGFERIGYGRLPADQLVQLKALEITPDYVAGFQRIGYRRLPVSKLVQMKALGITPDFLRRMKDESGRLPSEEELGSVRDDRR